MTFTTGERPARRGLCRGRKRSHPRRHRVVVRDVADLLTPRVSYVTQDSVDGEREREGSEGEKNTRIQRSGGRGQIFTYSIVFVVPP